MTTDTTTNQRVAHRLTGAEGIVIDTIDRLSPYDNNGPWTGVQFDDGLVCWVRNIDVVGLTTTSDPEAVASTWQHLRCTNDTNGNPRRIYAVYSTTGRLLAAIDEGYEGKPRHLNNLVELPSIVIPPAEYRRLIRWQAANGQPA